MEDLLVAILSMLLVFALIPLYTCGRGDRTLDRPTCTKMSLRWPSGTYEAETSFWCQHLVIVPDSTIDDDTESDEDAGTSDYYEAKASKKKEKRQQEREAYRQTGDAACESRSKKQDLYAEMRRKDEEREAKEHMLEEEAEARKAKEEKAASLDFEKWKGEFSVDAEGTTEEVEEGSQGLLSDFVDYIKKHKCIPLEDLTTEFKLRTQECINRISSLENMEEMQVVADYIKRQGRVSISHLASNPTSSSIWSQNYNSSRK